MAFGMAGDDEGRLASKPDQDYSALVDVLVQECKKLVQDGQLEDALEKLATLEKQTRTGGDMISTGRILVTIVELCYETQNWNALNEQLVLMAKRRGQLKQAVTKMVQRAMEFVDEITEEDRKLRLIDTLRTVTLGKIYVEVERARLSMKLATIKEAEGNIAEASTILQDLQVETFGSMDKREKVEFILEQMRLCLANRDFISLQIMSKKVSARFFENDQNSDLKLRFFQMMVAHGQHEKNFLTICKHYRSVYETKLVQDDADKRREALQNVVIFVLLSPFNNEQSDLMHRVAGERNLDEIPLYNALIKDIIRDEVLDWSHMCQTYEAELRTGTSFPATGSLSAETEDGRANWEALRKRVVEHNIRVIAKYYTQIRMSRMAQLLSLDDGECEASLSGLVVDKMIYARFDRLNGIVSFQQSSDPADLLNDWSRNITELTSLVNRTCHLINREDMVHALANRAA